eukprot:gene31672-41116_t
MVYGLPELLESINRKLDLLLTNQNLIASDSSTDTDITEKNVFNFGELGQVYDKEEILQYAKHRPALNKSLTKMTANILKERRLINSNEAEEEEEEEEGEEREEDESGDEYTVVQKHLQSFLDDVIVIAREICGDDSGPNHAAATSRSMADKRLTVEREWKYRVDVMSETAPPLLARPSRPVTVNRAGNVDGGFSNFSIFYNRALCFFEAKKTQLELSDLSKPGVYKAITQGAFQMLGDIKRLSRLTGIVPSYSSMLTNGLVWRHLRMIRRANGMFWIHSTPISVVKKKKQKQNQKGRKIHVVVDSDGIDLVVENILYVLCTAKNHLQEIVCTLSANQQSHSRKTPYRNYGRIKKYYDSDDDSDDDSSHQHKKPRWFSPNASIH